ncbi:hypothetical protein GJAV_G00168270 [Gymnothorax javanicus]|nr:hypothetical protein GJAV_G00168270 [Gymnothorax javanicus]
MMESLAPALLAELAKKKSSSSSAGKTQSSPSARTGKARKVTADSDEITLRLQGLHFSASYQELMDALQHFGKVKRAVLYKKIGEAAVVMEKEEDAKVLLETKELKIRGIRLAVSVEEDTAKDIKAKLLAKKKETPSAKPSTKAKVAAKKTDGSTVKKVVKKDLPKKYVVQISDLPESGYAAEDLQNLAKPFGFSDLVIGVEKKMAYVQLPDLDSVTKMLKTYKENPAKLQDHQLSFEQMTRPVDFKSPESLFRVLMGIEKTAETVNLGQRLLTVSNIPMGPKPAAEVKQLVKRFGSFKQDLVLYDKIILEMDTAAIAKTVYSRFQKFPCIVQNNPLTFSVIVPEAVKKKVDVKSIKPAPKAGPAAKKVVAAAKTAGAGSKSAVPKTTAGKGKVSKPPPAQAKSTGMKAKKPAVASTPDTAKTEEPASAAPPAVSPTTAAAEEPSAKPTVLTAESAAVSVEIADGRKSQSDVSAADQGSAEVSEVPPLETKEEEVESNTASQGIAAPAPAEGDEAAAKVEDEDFITKEGDSKQDDSEKGQKSTAEPKADACPPAGKSPPADAPSSAQAALDSDQKLLDFPPVTPEILRALEAAVQECRMRSSQRRGETKHAESAKSSPASGKELSPPKDKRRSRAQSEEDQPPVTTRGGSSGSSTGSRRSRHDHSPAPKRGKDPKGETNKHRGSSSSTSKSSSSSKTAGDKKSEEDVQDFTEDTFPFDFNEFVTVDEVGDEAESKEAEGKEPLQHSTPLVETSSTRKRTRDGAKAASASPPAKKPSSDAQKPQKKQAPSVKAKNAKTASPAATEAADEGGPEEVTEMESEASKMEVTVSETVEQEVNRDGTPAAPDAGAEDSAAKTALEVEEIKALEAPPDATVKTSTAAMETQVEGQVEGSGPSAGERNEAVPAAQKPEEAPAEQSLTDTADSAKGPAAPVPAEATDPGLGSRSGRRSPRPALGRALRGWRQLWSPWMR